MTKVAIGADQGGFELKDGLLKHYKNSDLELVDLGTYSLESVDYPDIAPKVVAKVLENEVDFGILICGTGVGISIAANRYKGIRAAIVYNDFVARVVRQHNNANILVFGGRTMELNDVIRYIDIYTNTSFEGGRHERRTEKLDNLEKE